VTFYQQVLFLLSTAIQNSQTPFQISFKQRLR
jgi:hypothetical protein